MRLNLLTPRATHVYTHKTKQNINQIIRIQTKPNQKKKQISHCIAIACVANKNCIEILQMPYLQLTDGGITVQQKDVKGAIAHTNKGVVRRMFVVNEPFSQASTQR